MPIDQIRIKIYLFLSNTSKLLFSYGGNPFFGLISTLFETKCATWNVKFTGDILCLAMIAQENDFLDKLEKRLMKSPKSAADVEEISEELYVSQTILFMSFKNLVF